MFKRLTWMTMGVGLALWGQRKVKAKVARYQPARVTAELAGSVRRLGDGVRVAAEEGRAAMREREAELRGARPGPVAGSGGP